MDLWWRSLEVALKGGERNRGVVRLMPALLQTQSSNMEKIKDYATG
jgi:hypothetical protein